MAKEKLFGEGEKKTGKRGRPAGSTNKKRRGRKPGRKVVASSFPMTIHIPADWLAARLAERFGDRVASK